MSYRRDSEVVPLSELTHFKDGLSYLAPGAEITTVWDYHANLVPLLRETGLQKGITVTSRYESLTGEPYEMLWTINPLLLPGGPYATKTGTTERAVHFFNRAILAQDPLIISFASVLTTLAKRLSGTNPMN